MTDILAEAIMFTNLHQLCKANMLRMMSDSGHIKLKKHEIQYASEAEDFLVQDDQRQLNYTQDRIISALYDQHVSPILECDSVHGVRHGKR